MDARWDCGQCGLVNGGTDACRRCGATRGHVPYRPPAHDGPPRRSLARTLVLVATLLVSIGVLTAFMIGRSVRRSVGEVPSPGPAATVEPAPREGKEGEALARARSLIDNYRLDEGEALLAAIVRDFPRSGLAHACLARVAYRRGLHTDGTCAPDAVARANAELAKAEALEPGLVDSMIVRSSLHRFTGDPARAREVALEAERVAPDSLRVALLLAQLEEAARDYDSAERRATQIVHATREGFLLDRAYDVLHGVYEARGERGKVIGVEHRLAEHPGYDSRGQRR